jgi:hypothetical protein
LSQSNTRHLPPYSFFSIFRCDLQHKNAPSVNKLRDLLTIRRVRDFFALLLSACSTVAVQKNQRGATHRDKPKMAQRQTETPYLKAVLFWLQEYWTH